MPPGRAMVRHGGEAAAEVELDLAPCILRGGWAPGPEQRRLLPRMRCAPCGYIVRRMWCVTSTFEVWAQNVMLVVRTGQT